ncbi:MAG: hypothetical protein K2O15_03630 [Lachnospiraceae bacterium]|nr:hypothetical protein [Lachnospiraceae bacterium]
MRNKKLAAMLGVMLCMGMMAGCAKTQEAPQAEVNEMSMEETGQDTDDTDEGQTVNTTQGVEYLSGKVQSPQEDGMILAQTTIMDENSQVTLLTVEEAKKIPVKFTADTKVEHWTIQGGGAGVDMKEALFSDLKEGIGVELEGYFEGDVFVASKVIIEVYA